MRADQVHGLGNVYVICGRDISPDSRKPGRDECLGWSLALNSGTLLSHGHLEQLFVQSLSSEPGVEENVCRLQKMRLHDRIL